MTLLNLAKQRINACISEIDSIADSEFPYSDSRLALENLKILFNGYREKLEKFDDKNDPDVIRQTCKISLDKIIDYLPLLGFILRSTNVRNGFEVFHPLLRLCKNVLQNDDDINNSPTHLVLSSEWDFSPFTYASVPDLPRFVLIGLPATESSNPLIIPLAGHEIGHSIWINKKLSKKYETRMQKEIINVLTENLVEFNATFKGLSATKDNLNNDLFVMQEWVRAFPWACQRAEETFCDFVGIRLFDTAYLQSFAYLTAPSWGNWRPTRYPDQLVRIKNIIAAAKSYNIQIPLSFEDQFDQLPIPPNISHADLFLLKIADLALKPVIQDLIEEVNNIIDPNKTLLSNKDTVNRVLQRFEKIIPAENSNSLTDILNAAWQAADEPDLWKSIPNIFQRRMKILRELVLKTIEILDIEQTIKENQ